MKKLMMVAALAVGFLSLGGDAEAITVRNQTGQAVSFGYSGSSGSRTNYSLAANTTSPDLGALFNILSGKVKGFYASRLAIDTNCSYGTGTGHPGPNGSGCINNPTVDLYIRNIGGVLTLTSKAE